MAENEYQEEGATEIDLVMRNYEYANMSADMGQCRFGFATDLKAVCAKGDSGATVYKFLKDASGSSNTASSRILFADANGAASSHASLTFDGTTLKIAGALRKAGESGDNLTLGAAGLVTLGGNLALGANTISRDGEANKGFGVSESGIPTVTATAATSGDVRTVLRLYDDTALGEGVGAGINLYGKFKTEGTYTSLGGIKVSKENGISGDYSSSFYIQTRKSGSYPANALRLDSSQNGYIKNKLMVGSLDETPENQLSVFKDADESVFLSVGNSKTGQNGVRIGIDDEQTGKAVYDISYGTFTHMFRHETSFGTGVYEPLMTLHFDSRPGYNNIARVYGDLQVDEQINVDGDAIIGGDITLGGVFDADDKITASAINAKLYDYSDYRLYIKGYWGNIALFENYDESWKSLRVFGDLVVDSNLNVGGLTASQIVETGANKKLISVAKGTAYNADFGTGSNTVCQGNDSRLSDARTPINNDYYVQGSSSTRTTDAGTTDLDSYSKSGFYKATTNAANTPTTGSGYGIIHTNYINDQYAFQLASRWDANRLYYRRQNSGTWFPWVELYHTGNFDPADYALVGHTHDALRLDQTPTSGTITPDKYIIINCNGTNYKIPVKAA